MTTRLKKRLLSLPPLYKKRLCLFFPALALGLACTLLSWPGIFYTDSYGRWFLAKALLSGDTAVLDDWLSVPPQLLMAALYAVTGSYASFTLVQSTAFFFTAFCAIGFFCPRGRLLSGVLFAACPVFYGFSVYIEMGVGCLCALLWLLMLALGPAAEKLPGYSPGKKALAFAWCFFLYFCMLGFRQNAFTTLPALALALALVCRRVKSRWPALLHGAAAALAFLFIAALPALLRFGIRNGRGPLAVGFLWETVSVLQEMYQHPDDYDYAPYADMLDYLGEDGVTQKAVISNIYESIYGYHQYIPNTVVGAPGNARRILSGYLRLAQEQPAAYWTVKARFAAHALGIAQPLSAGEYDYDRNGLMAEYGMRDSAARRAFYESYMAFQAAAPVLRRPFAVFAAVLALCALAWRFLQKQARVRLVCVYLAAVCFYASFLVNTQSQEFRYFFPPLALLYLCAAVSIGALCARALALLRARHKGTNPTKKKADA